VSYYPDLTTYSYLPDTVPAGVVALNVGWLEPEYPYPQGSTPDGFDAALGELCLRHPRAASRGWHMCRLTPEEGEPKCGERPKSKSLPPGKHAMPSPLELSIGGASISLGAAEVRVVCQDGTWLIAPNLVYHYVTKHGYLPPSEFLEAVMAGRVAPQE
jgi:hypothetical protein